jgi:hypothetical protein
MAKMIMFPALLALLFLILAGSCITIIVLVATTPLQGAVVVQSIALPGEPDFSNEKFWINQVAQSPTASPDLRALVMCVLSWVIAVIIVSLLVPGIKYVRQHAPTKQQHYAFKRTCVASEEWALSVAEEAWSPANSDQGEDD